MNTKRIEYIDAMRGFTMLLVVYSHILFYGYTTSFCNDISMGGEFLSFNALFIQFRMPLFFFISGFILYKGNYVWNRNESLSFLVKKAKVQLIPTFFFLSIYSFVTDASLFECCISSSKGGYWFTIALFEYFFIYVIFRIVCNKIGKKNGIDWLLLLGAFLLYFAVTPSCLRWLHVYDFTFYGISGINNLKYFLFFSIGTLVKKHFATAQKMLDNGYITGIGILLYFCISILVLHHGYFSNKLYTHIYLIVTGFLGLMLVFSFFRKYQSLFTQETKTGKILQFVGRRTLDVYLLHYFFLPHNLDAIGHYFTNNPNQTLELVVSIFLAIIVVAVCLVISQIIRISPVLAHWLFGVKMSDKQV